MKLLIYHTYLYYLQRLGLAVRVIRAMKHDLRRGTSDSVDSEYLCIGRKSSLALTICAEAASLTLLQQVMGYVYARTFQKYMNKGVQTLIQASSLGIPSEDALMNILSHQVHYLNPRTPSNTMTCLRPRGLCFQTIIR